MNRIWQGLYWLGFCLLLAGCAHRPVEPLTYVFHPGTPLKKQYLKNEKIIKPTLALFRGKNGTTRELPLGAKILGEVRQPPVIFYSYMDERFAAFSTEAIHWVSLDQGVDKELVKGVVYLFDCPDDSLLLGVERVGKKIIPGNMLLVNFGFLF